MTLYFFFQAEDGIRDVAVTGVQTCALPIFGAGDQWAPSFSNAAADGARRQAAVDETAAALAIARRIPFSVLVVHLGTPESKAGAGDNNRAAASRSVEEICRLAEPLGVKVALEV